ncbi:LysR family transcriptional regulator [Metapseudomonas lalkuanensis]|uniref:LysR family transcriptional regulator n=1 Tax=Metapseudomonas lalkuanensis TaxID=2604832 RepID=A0A5J6QHS8_9GAMM|nr:LysR substrate-binding domain-containing protein [Pseudomonas lalkuanensis]QEY61923.1 LysR family transcriptional regulator [Pseudomonas lalkuanensis]UCO99704.1 LysR family transcriptional regulator [Pseudomonas lalkuanensis]
MKRLPPLPALHTFLITAQCCNFTRAAETLHITQGAVSRQIAGLESHLGYPLFLRQARGLALTEQGRDLYPRIQQVFALIDEAVEEVGAKRKALQLKAPTCAMRWLLPRLMKWQAERPDVPVELTTTIAYGVDFRRDQFDAAIIYGTAPGGNVTAHHLFNEQLTPVCTRHYLERSAPLSTPAELEHHVLLHPARDKHDWETWLLAAGHTPGALSGGHHFDTMDLALSVAAQGAGVALGDWSLIGDDLANGNLVAPFDFKVPTGGAYFVVYPERTAPSPQLREFSDWLVAEAHSKTARA